MNIGPNLAKNIEVETDKATVSDFLGQPIPESMFITNVEEQEVINIVRNLKNKTSYDADDINMTIIKSVFQSILKPFVHICNKSFQSGVFPEKMKLAKITPLFKENDKQVVNNYRPISLLPQFSKIMEKLFSKRLDNFIEKNKVLKTVSMASETECQHQWHCWTLLRK